MKILRIKKFTGLSQDIDFSDLVPGQAYNIENLNVDIPSGILSLRDGSQVKYDQTFQNIISIFEHKFPTSDETHLIVNDNGTLKVYNGSSWTTLTMPVIYGSSAQIDTSFTNQYFGYNDAVLITTGNGENNYLLWYGYINDSKGTFGSPSGYYLTRAQLIATHGTFSNIKSQIKIGDYYYVTIEGSKFIEKRNSNYQLVELIDIFKDVTSLNFVKLCQNDTYVYAIVNGADDSSKDGIYMLNKSLSKIQSFLNKSYFMDIYADNFNVFAVASDGASGGGIYWYGVDLAVHTSSTGADYRLVVGNSSSNSTAIYVVEDSSPNQLQLRQLSTSPYSIGAASKTYGGSSYNDIGTAEDLYYDGSNVYFSDTYNDFVRHVDGVDLNLVGTITGFSDPTIFFDDCSMVVDGYGILDGVTDNAIDYPSFIGIRAKSNGTGDLASGHYYYKVSVVDDDGNEYTLSDHVRVVLGSSGQISVTITLNDDNLNEYYRIKHLNVYRAYSSVDSDVPDTEYAFLKKIPIDDTGWILSVRGFYYFTFDDNFTTSTVTYLENSGISDMTKPRHINGKYILWDGVQLHLANVYSDGKTYKNLIVKSPENQPFNLSLYDVYSFGSSGLDIKGLAYWLGRVIAFKINSMGVFNNGSQEMEYPIGLSSETGIANLKNGLVFANDKGVYYYNGNDPIIISDPIADTYLSQSSFDDLTLFYFEDKNRLIISKSGTWSFVYNTKEKTWVKYSSGFAWSYYLKTISNEYLCFVSPGSGSQYIYYIKGNSKDKVNYDGTGGTEISITYDSGLLKLMRMEGYNVLIFEVDPRFEFSGTSLSFKMYKYTNSGKVSIVDETLTSPTGGYVFHKTIYPDNAFGESFSFTISGTVTNITFTDLTIIYDPIGMIANE